MAVARGTTTSLWWDMESCPLPSYVDPYIVASIASALLRNFKINTSKGNAVGGTIDNHPFSAYDFFSETQTELHQGLVNSGIGLHQLPPVTGKRKELEKMMIADILLWAMDNPPPANIIFIVGNVDLCYVFQKLRQRSYNVFLVCQSMSEIPQGMLGGANNCLGWLLFLMSLQNEVQPSHIHGGITVYDALYNTAFPTSSTSFHSKEMEKLNNASSFNYSQNNSFGMNPSLGDEWDSTCNFPPCLSNGWDGTCNFQSDEKARRPVQPEHRFHGHFTGTKTRRSPISSASSSTEKKKVASLEDFRAWLTLTVNDKKHAEEGYKISPIRVDFEKATGKILDEKFQGFSKIINLLQNCKDIAEINEVKRGCHHAFPVKSNEQKDPNVHQVDGIKILIKSSKSKDKPRAEANPKPKRIA